MRIIKGLDETGREYTVNSTAQLTGLCLQGKELCEYDILEVKLPCINKLAFINVIGVILYGRYSYVWWDKNKYGLGFYLEWMSSNQPKSIIEFIEDYKGKIKVLANATSIKSIDLLDKKGNIQKRNIQKWYEKYKEVAENEK